MPRDESIRAAFNHSPARSAAPLPLVFLDQIEPSLDVMDFVQGVLVEKSAALVFGDSNAGKTFWTTDLSLHIAAGLIWNGCRVEQGSVIYCVLEGSRGFRNRVTAWKRKHGLEGAAVPFAVVEVPLNLLEPGADTARLIATVEAVAADLGLVVKLIVVDTLSRALAGGNESGSEDMGALVRNMDTIRAATGACVLFIHHSGKDTTKGARGWSGLRAAIDTEIEVVADEATGIATATVTKQRDMKKGGSFGFRLQTVVLGRNRHGEDVTTCTVEAVDSSLSRPARRPLPAQQAAALQVLQDAVAEHGEAGHADVPSGVLSVPKECWRERFYEQMSDASQDTRKRAFSRAVDGLQDGAKVAASAGRVWLV